MSAFSENGRIVKCRTLLRTILVVWLLAHVSAAGVNAAPEEGGDDYVYLINADEIRFNQRINADAQILVGNVVFRHDSMYMYCDSALFYQNANSFDAYRNIRAEQGDTLFMFGDALYYDGETKIARIRDNVRLENRDMILLTDSLNYDRNINLGYFFNGGTLLDIDNTLTSDYGQYDINLGVAVFRDSVLLENENYTLDTDTLTYNVDRHTAFFTSPSTIVSDENVIRTSHGWFDTQAGNSVLLDRSIVDRSDGEQQMTGDSIVYNDEKNCIWGYGNVIVNDFADSMDVLGDYVFYDRSRDSALITGNAQAIEYSREDSLFMHADTFRLCTIYGENDTIMNRQVKAYHHVKAFSNDMQLVCDSLEFQSSDSCLTLYRDPVLWSGRQQILGEVIKAYMNDSTIDWVHVIGQALSVEQIDTVMYNQIGGREMKAFFVNGDIYRTTVDGNVQVVYYPFDSDSTLIGMNTTEASNLEAFFNARKVEKIVVHQKSNGVMYPISQIPAGKSKLSNFVWLEVMRPFSRYDIFYWRGKQASEKLKESHINRNNVPLPSLPKGIKK